MPRRSQYPRDLNTAACILTPPFLSAAGWVLVRQPVPALSKQRPSRSCGPRCDFYPTCSSRTDIVLPCEGLLPFELTGPLAGPMEE